VRKQIDYGLDDHAADDPERARVAWAVAALDDCDECGDIRIELTLEEEGRAGTGVAAHLSAASARRVRATLARALAEVGEPVSD
jgi:hypothetical protein